jgi:hypothetical protein
MDYLSTDTDFNLLSLRDLLLARDQFHLHLIHKPNVVATAVGRYRIRKDELWPNQPGHRPKRGVRTLANSEVRPYSWPAILVFVRRWVEAGEFANHADAIPPAVYMPNGQRVPLCVVVVERDDVRPEGVANYNYPPSIIGGGYPVICDVQGREHVASVACIVTDGHRAYGLTNRHVAGEGGSPIYSLIGGNKERIGVAAPLQLTREVFSSLYPGWPGENVYVDLDVGLIDIDDLNRWTTQVYGVGQIGELADVDTSNLSLRLIGCPVRGYGAASRQMTGEVCALFYRYQALGGFEYVSDLLIGPRGDQPLGTHPGDSGTLWLIDDGDRAAPQPLALQWGGQVFLDNNKTASSYALATFLSTVCNKLNITLVRDWNIGLPEYWGAVGHYSIAGKGIGKIRNANLKRLMTANLERITFDLDQINKKAMAGLSKRDFVPLADVPDMVWKVGPHKRGGMSAPEHANHFADMDRKLDQPLPEGATLLEICDGKPQNVAVPVWQRYYDAVKEQFPDQEESRGLLPFRAWQIYDQMVASVRAGEVDKFVCAAGILSHYVGDACQPLHISYMFNGDPDNPVDGTGRNEGKQVAEGTGVHAAYEDEMVDAHVPEIMAGIDQRLAAGAVWPLVQGGQGAAVAVVGLMLKTFAAITPRQILEAFVPLMGDKPSARAKAMWDTLGDPTIDVMADGCFCLAELWDSAWQEGGGDTSINQFDAIDEETLAALYQNSDFLHSYTLNTIGPHLQNAPAAAPAGGNAAPRRRAGRQR